MPSTKAAHPGAMAPKTPGATRAAATERGHAWVAEALRRAQSHVRSQEKWSHPRYWAAWVLWGLPN